MSKNRLIFYHKQNTSARLRFLKFANGSICAFHPLPALSQLLDSSIDADDEGKVIEHPAHLLQEAADRLGLALESLKVHGGYHVNVDTCNGPVKVYLAELNTIDPPFQVAADMNAEFIDLTQARNLAIVELELLRLAYEFVM